MAQPLEKLARTPMVILNSKRSIIRNLYDLMNSDILCTALTYSCFYWIYAHQLSFKFFILNFLLYIFRSFCFHHP